MMADLKLDLQATSYTPNRFLDRASEIIGAWNDAELAHLLNCHQAALSRIRGRKAPITPGLMVKVMDRTHWTTKELRALAGMPDPVGLARLRLGMKPTYVPTPPPPTPKISDAEVMEIYYSDEPAQVIAVQYGISKRYVQLIRRGKARCNVVAHMGVEE